MGEFSTNHATPPAPASRVASPVLQRSALRSTEAQEAPAVVHDVLRSQGQALNDTTLAQMEPRFRQDFSGVRVHTNDQAAESASAVGALAYTVGRNIVFAQGK
jgi:hypothetical protein